MHPRFDEILIPVPNANQLLVRTHTAFVPQSWSRQQSRIDKISKLYPRRIRKILTYAIREGFDLTLSKVRTKMGWAACDVSNQACSVTGEVIAAGSAVEALQIGDRVACCGFAQAFASNYYLFVPEQCIKLEVSDQSWASAILYGTWLYHLIEVNTAEVGKHKKKIILVGARHLLPLVDFACRQLNVEFEGFENIPSNSKIQDAFLIVIDAQCLNGNLPLLELNDARILLLDFKCSTHNRLPSLSSVVQFPNPSEKLLDIHAGKLLDWPTGLELENRRRWLRKVRIAGGISLNQSSLIEYKTDSDITEVARTTLKLKAKDNKSKLGISFVGAGNFSRAVLMHYALKHSGVALRGVMDRNPKLTLKVAKDMKAAFCTTSYNAILDDLKTQAVFIITYHDSHAELGIQALNAGKMVFIEKPPAVSMEQLQQLVKSAQTVNRFLFVGYNRPYAPFSKIVMDTLVEEEGPTSMTCVVRLYDIAKTNWYYWPQQGTRIVGNACHWIDYGYRLVGRKNPLRVVVEHSVIGRPDENNTIAFTFEDGSLLTIVLTNRGSQLLGGQEWIDIKKGRTAIFIDDFRKLIIERNGRTKKIQSRHRDKGHRAEINHVIKLMKSGMPQKSELDDMIATTLMTLGAKQAMETGRPYDFRPFEIELSG